MKDLQNGLSKMVHILINLVYGDKDEETIEDYKNFHLQLTQRVFKSRLGCYNMITKDIQLSGIGSECRRDIVITLLHEVSHHIEYMDTGHTGHSKTFYEIHKKLLEIAIDLGILTLSDITENKSSAARNSDKIGRMMQGYQRKGIHLLSDYMDVSFLNGLPKEVIRKEKFQVKCVPEEKEILKNHSYKWNSQYKTWEKETSNTSQSEEEKEFLFQNRFYKIKIGNECYYTRYIKVSVMGDTYPYRKVLKKRGYVYSDKVWNKQVSADKIQTEMLTLKLMPGVKILSKF